MKTKVRIKSKAHQTMFEVGTEGYIDGYVRGGDDRPCAVVVCGDKLDMIPLYSLEVI